MKINFKRSIKKNAPTLLTFMSIGCMIGGIVSAITVTPKVVKALEQAEEEKGSPLTKTEVIKKSIKYYIPTASLAVASALGAIHSNKINQKRYAALLTVYSLTDKAYKEYKEQVKEAVGERKEKRIVADANQKRLDKDPVNNTTIVVTGGGETLFYEPLKKLYFKTSMQKVEKAINELNQRMINSQYISYNDYLDNLRIPRLDPKKDGIDGETIGWSVFRYLIDPTFTLGTSDEDQACFYIDHSRYPPDTKFKDMF